MVYLLIAAPVVMLAAKPQSPMRDSSGMTSSAVIRIRTERVLGGLREPSPSSFAEARRVHSGSTRSSSL
jgi:hypothetical protein